MDALRPYLSLMEGVSRLETSSTSRQLANSIKAVLCILTVSPAAARERHQTGRRSGTAAAAAAASSQKVNEGSSAFSCSLIAVQIRTPIRGRRNRQKPKKLLHQIFTQLRTISRYLSVMMMMV